MAEKENLLRGDEPSRSDSARRMEAKGQLDVSGGNSDHRTRRDHDWDTMVREKISRNCWARPERRAARADLMWATYPCLRTLMTWTESSGWCKNSGKAREKSRVQLTGMTRARSPIRRSDNSCPICRGKPRFYHEK